jgi:hypothetical protein
MKENLPLELNFTVEARNCERTGRNFAHRKDVVVPRIHHQMLSPRVMVMELYVRCCAAVALLFCAAAQLSACFCCCVQYGGV